MFKRPRHAPRNWPLSVAVGGGGLSLLASAAISFEGLTGLGRLIGIQPPWLLPLAIDIYAATCTVVALLLASDHPARRTAVWNATLGLVMSMAGNAAERGLTLGWTRTDVILMVAGACPSLIVERLMHLQGAVARPGATVPQNATVPRDATPVAGATVAPATAATVAAPTVATRTPAPAKPATATPAKSATAKPATPAAAKAPVAGSNQRVAINDVVLGLLAKHGTDDGQVTSVMVAEAMGGVHKTTGYRQLIRVRKELDAGKLHLPAAAMSSSLSSSPTQAPAMAP